MKAATVLAAAWTVVAPNPPPAIEVDAEGCAPRGHRPLVCALVADDTAVARVRAVFRAGGSAAYYWTAMTFDGTRYCAWLPQPLAATAELEFYVEAFDDAYESSRSRGFTVAVKDECARPEARPASAPPLVGTTRAGQPAAPPGFEPSSYRLPGASPR